MDFKHAYLIPLWVLIVDLFVRHKSFSNWCYLKLEESTDLFQFSNRYEKLSVETKVSGWEDTLFDAINTKLSNGEIFSILIDRSLSKNNYNIDGKKVSYASYIDSLEIKTLNPGMLVIKNVSIRKLKIYIKESALNYLSLVNCNIRTIDIHGVVDAAKVRLELVNSRVGIFSANANMVHRLVMSGGCMLNLEIPSPESKNPFTGFVSFKKVFFPKNTAMYPLEDSQPYRNLRHHLSSLDNTQMASLIYAKQLAVESEDDPLTYKILGLFYDLFSKSGSSVVRPIAWLFLSWLFVYANLVNTKGAVLGMPISTGVYTGWKAKLIDPKKGAEKRALLLSIQQIANPLGIFGARTLVVAKNSRLATVGGIHSVFSALFITLFIFSLRRRFKIQ